MQYPHSGRAQRNAYHCSRPEMPARSCSTLTRVEPNATRLQVSGETNDLYTCSTLTRVEPNATQVASIEDGRCHELAVPSLGSSPTQRPSAVIASFAFFVLQYPHSGRAQRNSGVALRCALVGYTCSTLTRVEPNATAPACRCGPSIKPCSTLTRVEPNATQVTRFLDLFAQFLQYPHSGRAQRNYSSGMALIASS